MSCKSSTLRAIACGWIISALSPLYSWSQEAVAEQTEKGKFDASWLSAFSFRSIGPAFMSGRISDLAIDPQQPNTWYLGAGSGGVWKTTNSGTTWTPVFDGQASYSIGCIAIDPSNHDTVWVGTGENVSGRHVGVGDGVYVSHDGGATWTNKGLKLSEHISKIWVDPRNAKVVLVAVQGPLWAPGGERGLYKTTDGGETWRQVLAKGPYTGVTDIVSDPSNPDVLYAATYQRHRTVWALLDTGPESGIYKSTDGGETWNPLTHGLPGEDKGKISLGVSPQKNHVVYATIELPNRTGGFWRSEDHGNSWSKVSDFVSGGTGPHYYQEIFLDPHRYDVIYHANNDLMRSTDGGRSWKSIEGKWKHVDNHAVAFRPDDSEYLLVGTDGGVYESHDYAKSFRFFANLPLTQFYKIDVDYDLPFYHVVGGTQDNNSQYGPTRTRLVQGIRNSDWIITLGGDGHDNAIDPSNPDIIYGESQEGFIRRFDRKTGESIDVQPQPGKGEDALRFNWDSPMLISPHNPSRLYFGSRMLHRSDDRGDSWRTISPDLSRAQNRWTLPIMGRVWGIDAGFDLLAMSQFGNITSISESPKVEGLIYVGTDDGLIHVTEDGGANWRKIEKIYGVPEQAFVNDVKADRHDPNTVYVAMDHHKTGDFKPYLLRSKDRGVTWESIANNLPDRHLVWRLEQDHVEPNLLFVGTEYGIFTSLDAGKSWHELSGGLPTISFRDLAIQTRENDLLGASFGRGIYVLDDYSPLRQLAKPDVMSSDLVIFPPRKTPWYLPADALGGEKGFQGMDFFTAPNPTFGTVFTVFLKSATKSKKAIRNEAEEAARKENRDVPIPSWDELRAESEEEGERIFLEITDASNRMLKRIDGPDKAGMHRIHWDLRYSIPGLGVPMLVAPGTYKVQAKKLHAGEIASLGEPVEFVVESILQPTLVGRGHAEINAYLEKAIQVQIAMMEASSQLNRLDTELVGRVDLVRDHATDLQSFQELLQAAKKRSKELHRRLQGDRLLNSRFVQSTPSIAQRIGHGLNGAAESTYGPTQTHQQQLEIGEQELSEFRNDLQQFEAKEITDLRNRMTSAGLNWFPPAPPPPAEPMD